MQLNEKWSYKEILSKMKQLRKEYLLICNSFDYQHLHERVLFRTQIKRFIYNYPFSETQKNIIWLSLNRGYRRRDK